MTEVVIVSESFFVVSKREKGRLACRKPARKKGTKEDSLVSWSNEKEKR